MLQVIMFALLLGVAISKSGKQGESLASFFEDLTNVILKMVTILLQLAPYGVFCLLAKIFSNQGDLLPASRTTLNLVKSVTIGEDGHEETIHRRADDCHFKGRRSRRSG